MMSRIALCMPHAHQTTVEVLNEHHFRIHQEDIRGEETSIDLTRHQAKTLAETLIRICADEEVNQ